MHLVLVGEHDDFIVALLFDAEFDPSDLARASQQHEDHLDRLPHDDCPSGADPRAQGFEDLLDVFSYSSHAVAHDLDHPELGGVLARTFDHRQVAE